MKRQELTTPLYHIFFAISLIGLVYGGVYKSFLLLGNIVIFDLTILSTLSLIMLIGFGEHLRITKEALQLGIILSVFSVVYFGSLLYSPSITYGPHKMFACLGLLFSFIVGLIVPSNTKKYFFSMIPYFGILSSFAYFYVIAIDFDLSKLRVFNGVSLSIGEILGLGSVLLICKKKKSMLVYLLLILSSLLLLALGARGPFIFFMLIYLVLIAVNFFQSYGRSFVIKKKNAYLFVLVVMITVTLFNLLVDSHAYEILEKGLSRFYLLFENDKGNSINVRQSMGLDAWHYIGEAPIFGHGLGSYGTVVNGIDGRAYPHNAILEIWFEAGIFGVLSFLVFVSISLAQAVARNDRTVMCLIIFLGLNFLKSSSLDELRMFFLICGLSVGTMINGRRL